MAFPTVLVLLIITIVVIQIRLRKSNKEDETAKKEFWEKEKSSLVVRKKELTEKDFIRIPNDHLILESPSHLEPGEQLYAKQLLNQLKALEKEDMMNHGSMTNTDIRLTYGTANQTIITENENHYHQYISSLGKLADLFISKGDQETATLILERCIAMESDYTKHFIALAGLYKDSRDLRKLDALIEKVENMESPLKKGLLESLASFRK